ASEMAAYLRVWLNRGMGHRGRVVSEASFDHMTVGGAHPEKEEGWAYGYGLGTRTIDGRTRLGHGGGMGGYASAMYAEREAGDGALFVDHAGVRLPIRRRPDERFLVEHKDFEQFLLGFKRREGAVVAAHHGPDRWIREGTDPGPAAPPADPEEDAFTAHYRS